MAHVVSSCFAGLPPFLVLCGVQVSGSGIRHGWANAWLDRELPQTSSGTMVTGAVSGRFTKWGKISEYFGGATKFRVYYIIYITFNVPRYYPFIKNLAAHVHWLWLLICCPGGGWRAGEGAIGEVFCMRRCMACSSCSGRRSFWLEMFLGLLLSLLITCPYSRRFATATARTASLGSHSRGIETKNIRKYWLSEKKTRRIWWPCIADQRSSKNNEKHEKTAKLLLFTVFLRGEKQKPLQIPWFLRVRWPKTL